MISTNEDYSMKRLNKHRAFRIVPFSIGMNPMIDGIRNLHLEKSNTIIVKHATGLNSGSAWRILIFPIAFSNSSSINCPKRP